MNTEEEILKLKALTLVQAADISALLGTICILRDALRKHHPLLPDVSQSFLTTRREIVHRELEDLETKNPALAAKVQQMIDKSSTNYPFDYE